MASNVGQVVRQIRHLAEGYDPSVDDAELLRRFTASRDEAAFAALVKRHGPLVFGLCRRLLQSTHDAEDALQATFLVLARRAGALRQPASLAGWLYGVAHRVARKMKTQRDKRAELETKSMMPTSVEPEDDLSWRELRAVIDEEVQRLPEQQRQPLLLCYFLGLTQEEAARQLGWARGTLKRRLESGRSLLKDRLTRRGLTLSAALVGALEASDALAAPVPASWSTTLAQAATLFVDKNPLPAALVPAHVITLAEGVLKTMLVTKLKLFSAVLAVALVLGFGAVTVAMQALIPGGDSKPAVVEAQPQILPKVDQPPADNQAAQEPAPKAEQPPIVVPPKGDAGRLQGVWDLVEVESPLMPKPSKIVGPTVTFIGEDYVYQTGDGSFLKAKFKLDEAAKPRSIDLTYYETKNRPGNPGLWMPTVGVYKIDGDKLVLALGIRADAPEAQGLPQPGRPFDFKIRPGTGAAIFRLERKDVSKQGKQDAGEKNALGHQRWTGFYGTEQNQVRLVIRDEKEWEAVWAKSKGAPRQGPTSDDPRPLEKVDFTKHMVLAAFMGNRENGGHIVDITRVVLTPDGCKAYVREYSPPRPGTPKVTQSPYCLVVVPRVEGKVTFADEGSDEEEIVVLNTADFPVRLGPLTTKEKETIAKRLDEGYRKKYHGKLVQVAGMVKAKPAATDDPQLYTLRLTVAVKLEDRFSSASIDVDVIPANASPELNQPSRSGLIAEVVGRCEVDAKGRLLLKDAKVLRTSVPPG